MNLDKFCNKYGLIILPTFLLFGESLVDLFQYLANSFWGLVCLYLLA